MNPEWNIDDWAPNTKKLKIVEVKANDEVFLQELKQENEMPEFYDPVKDLKHAKWAERKYGKIGKILSCPSCFTSVSFDCKVDGEIFVATETFHTRVGEKVHKSENENFLSVTCEVCSCTLGVLDPETHLFHLFHVLEGNS